MGTTEVHGELVVNKHPNVVVTAEAEAQTRLVDEVCMGFKAELLVTATGTTGIFIGLPTDIGVTRIVRRSFGSAHDKRPTIRTTGIAIATPAPDIVITHHGRRGKNIIQVVTIIIEAFAIRLGNALVPTRAIAHQVHTRSFFAKSRINLTQIGIHVHRALGQALCTRCRNRLLRGVSVQDVGILSRFNRIEATSDACSRASELVGVEFPTVVIGTAERHVEASHFVHALRILEHLVKNRGAREALLGIGRIGEMRLFVCTKSINDDVMVNTETVLDIVLRLRRAQALGTLLAAFRIIRSTTIGPARERRVQTGVGIVNNSGQVIATRSLNHRVRSIEATIRFVLPLILVRDKEDCICRISFIIGLQRNRLGDIFFCRTVHAKSGIKHLGIVTHEHDIVRNRFTEPYIVEPSATIRVSRHTHGSLATVQAHHRDSRHPGVIFLRNEEVNILGVRRFRINHGRLFLFRVQVDVNLLFVTRARNHRLAKGRAVLGIVIDLEVDDLRSRVVHTFAIHKNEAVVLRIRLRADNRTQVDRRIASAILWQCRGKLVRLVCEVYVACRPSIRQLNIHRTQASCKRSLHPCKKQHYT